MGHGGYLAHIESAEEEASLESVIPADVTYWIDFQHSDYVDDGMYYKFIQRKLLSTYFNPSPNMQIKKHIVKASLPLRSI